MQAETLVCKTRHAYSKIFHWMVDICLTKGKKKDVKLLFLNMIFASSKEMSWISSQNSPGRTHLQQVAVCLLARQCSKHSKGWLPSRDSLSGGWAWEREETLFIECIICCELFSQFCFWHRNQFYCEINFHQSTTTWHTQSRSIKRIHLVASSNELLW